MPNDLWSFALAAYSRPGIEQACLRAQDRGGIVCLLLCAAWLDALKCPWNIRRQVQLQRLAQDHETRLIAPLRALRRTWREAAQSDTEVAELREQVKQLELRAERILCERLQAACRSWPADLAASAAGGWLERFAEGAALRLLLEQDAGE